MQRTRYRPIAGMALIGASLVGCAAPPAAQGLRETRDLVTARDGGGQPSSSQSPSETNRAVQALLAHPLSADAAVQVGLLRNPRMQLEYARLGIAEADVLDASRLSNPTLSLSVLDPRAAGTPARLDAGISQAFTDLLLLKPRKRLAVGEYARAQQDVAASILDLTTDIRSAWYSDVGAQHVATMRDAVARAAQISADLAARFHDAGNISVLQLNLEQATATQARLTATRARAEATQTRAALSQLMGVREADGHWTTIDRLPSPVSREDSVEELIPIAAQQRLDVASARREVDLLEDALGITRHYRWLGRIDVGIAGERDTDRTRLLGPTLAVELPIFNQGQGAVARARARLEDSRARLQTLELSVDTSVRLGTERIQAARAVLEDYRFALIPEREAVVARTQENVNYMFAGAFELLQAKQHEYDAYQGYLEAVRDYWLARVDLAHAVGSRLPSDSAIREPSLGPESAASPPIPDPSHSHHESSGGAP